MQRRDPHRGTQALKSRLTLADRLDQKIFDAIYARSLVYNTCWEDPAVDRQALELSGTDTLLAITSAGCNVLDYALVGPRRIFAVDANPRQTALLELKIAGIRHLAHDDFFAVFGRGHHPHFVEMYRDVLRSALSPFARGFWDERATWFSNRLGGFYFHGLSGTVARAFRAYLKCRRGLARPIRALFEAPALAAQRALYESEYVCGAYTAACCPEYLKPVPFARLKAGLVDRITTATCTVTEFLARGAEPISRFVLLDHMD